MKRVIACGLLLLAFIGLLLGHGFMEKHFVGSRVEVFCGKNAEAVQQTCAASPELAKDGPAWEKDRLVFLTSDLFTAQRVRTVLTRAGLEDGVLILDYSWALEVLTQSSRLWRIAGTFALLWFLLLAARWQISLELHRGRKALERQYLGTYMSNSGVRLMEKAIAFVVGAFGVALLLRYLIEFSVALPATLLPQGSLFQLAHYRQWQEATFPVKALSTYGKALHNQLICSHLLAGLESVVLILLAAAGGGEIEKQRRSLDA